MKRLLFFATSMIGLFTILCSSPPLFSQCNKDVKISPAPIAFGIYMDDDPTVAKAVGERRYKMHLETANENEPSYEKVRKKLVDVIELLPEADRPAARLAEKQREAEMFYRILNLGKEKENEYRHMLYKGGSVTIKNIPKLE